MSGWKKIKGGVMAKKESPRGKRWYQRETIFTGWDVLIWSLMAWGAVAWLVYRFMSVTLVGEF